ncbi:MAG: NAD-dependent epimerase/dehydratase family protein [Aliidongia sp.]
METFLITGGAGFLGSAIAFRLRSEYPAARIIALDNLRRRGSELNVPRLAARGIEFRHGDIRSPGDLEIGALDAIVECSAEPSVLAGRDGDARYLLDTNLGGAINCLELARRGAAALLFVSTSRVYPFDRIGALPLATEGDRFVLDRHAALPPGVTVDGVTTEFALPGRRTLYGASKLAAELIVQEFADVYNLPALIVRFGVIAGPWQMGKLDQGFVALWAARHHAGKPLSYCGYGGNGHQLRDVLHVDDAVDLVTRGLSGMAAHRGSVFNAGGGIDRTISLAELTVLCQSLTGRSIIIDRDPATRPGDIPWYVTDNAAVSAAFGWAPTRSVGTTVADVCDWIAGNSRELEVILHSGAEPVRSR